MGYHQSGRILSQIKFNKKQVDAGVKDGHMINFTIRIYIYYTTGLH